MNKSDFSTTLYSSPTQKSSNNQPQPNTKNEESVGAALEQVMLVDDITAKVRNLKQINLHIGERLVADDPILNKFSESVENNRNKLNKVNKNVDQALQRKKKGFCSGLGTLGTVFMIYFVTMAAIRLIPPHPFGLK
ncbi:MAG: hypothetical protein EZS28_027867 [Streblomastix strix]|uniref:t-SNARE coiled-coil homology domain-containing protein n=1 Tax=Streblomastix strix TaxID=222440 RepID=A0A5J4V0V4_9EUKA|nr:MAG: hypothetical protein EZS28_027867 [Streblomastix strix]